MLMIARSGRVFALLSFELIAGLSVVLIAGCGNDKADVSPERLAKLAGGSLKKPVPVSGTVLVDGNPEKGVNVYLYQDGNSPSIKNCRTDEKGQFCWSSYVTCDGLEAGDYRLGFEFVPKQLKNDRGKDLFKGKYKNPMKNEFLLSVKDGAPQKDLKYELKLK